ncbi:hypothetical protein EB796_013292 [Bugula neritina]|uniref:Uncharacterized protein n=1 Tax=Bugula neritina TaxID=10212 RepID=A0A7J7JR90_BUGNE|nr:hypothetical protein EB796_013292 [Bugula neritina]
MFEAFLGCWLYLPDELSFCFLDARRHRPRGNEPIYETVPSAGTAQKEAAQKGFVVSGAPWDTNSTEDFPTIGGGAAPAANGGSRVGPWGRRH